MSLQNIQNLVTDFCRDNTPSVILKQYDKDSRFIIVKCTENGVFKKLDNKSMNCKIKVLTPDNRAIYKDSDVCEILDDGTIKVSITESMVYASGVAKAELNVIDNSTNAQLSPMTFNMIVKPSAYGDDKVIASDEFSVLTKLITKAEKDYTYIITETRKSADNAKSSETNARSYMNSANTYKNSAATSATDSANSAKLSQSWAVGGTSSRNGEDINNSKYYATQSSNSASEAKTSETNSKTKASEALTSANNAKISETNADKYASNAKDSENNAKISETNANTYMNNASASASTASTKAIEASSSAESASNSLNTIEIKSAEIKQIENDVIRMKSDVSNMKSNVASMQAQVEQDKSDIDTTIKNSLLEKSEEILNAMKDYFDRAQQLYNSMYIDCDGETPQQRVVSIVSIDCGTPQSRSHDDNGILFDGGTPLNRQLAS